jgi:hypothetical protein
MVPLRYRCRVLCRGIQDTYRGFGFWNLFGPIIILSFGWPIQLGIVKWKPEAKTWIGDPTTQWWNGLMYAGCAVGVIWFVVAAFNIFMAPSRMDAEKDSAIAERDNSIADLKTQFIAVEERPSLTISFDPNDGPCLQESEIATMLRVRISLNPETAGTKHLKVVMKRIEAIKSKRKMQKKLAVFQGAPLMEKHDDCEPVKRDFSLSPGDSLYFDVIKEITDAGEQDWAAGKIFLCHAIGARALKPTDTERSILGNGQYVRHPKDELPLIGYTIEIKATAERVDPCIATFRVGRNRKGRTTFRMIGIGSTQQNAKPLDATAASRLEAAKKRILQLSDMICLYALGAFVPGPDREPRDWKQSTKQGLRAIVRDDICYGYEKILRIRTPKEPAKLFLMNLADTLAISHLRT